MYELTRVELLRDLYVWAYERSTQEYQAIQQDLAEPDPLRLAYRDLIKQTVRQVVQQPQADPLKVIKQALEPVPQADRGMYMRCWCRSCSACMRGFWHATGCDHRSWWRGRPGINCYTNNSY